MRRELLIQFMIWLCCFLLGFLLLYHSFDFGPFAGFVIQTWILAFVAGLNYFYLFYILYKLNQEAAVIFVMISVVVLLALSLYHQLVKDADARLQFIVFLVPMMITTVGVHVVRKRRSSRR